MGLKGQGETGKAYLSGSHNLKNNCGYIIHTIGPDTRGKKSQSDWVEHEQKLTDAYNNTLEVASSNNITQTAFCAISTAIYGCPIEKTTPVAINTIIDHIQRHPHTHTQTQEIRFVTYSALDYNVYRDYLTNLSNQNSPILSSVSVDESSSKLSQLLAKSSSDATTQPPLLYSINS